MGFLKVCVLFFFLQTLWYKVSNSAKWKKYWVLVLAVVAFLISERKALLYHSWVMNIPICFLPNIDLSELWDSSRGLISCLITGCVWHMHLIIILKILLLLKMFKKHSSSNLIVHRFGESCFFCCCSYNCRVEDLVTWKWTSQFTVHCLNG